MGDQEPEKKLATGIYKEKDMYTAELYIDESRKYIKGEMTKEQFKPYAEKHTVKLCCRLHMKQWNVLDYLHGIYIICMQTLLEGVPVAWMGPET